MWDPKQSAEHASTCPVVNWTDTTAGGSQPALLHSLAGAPRAGQLSAMTKVPARVSRARGSIRWSCHTLGAIVPPARPRRGVGQVGLDYHGHSRMLQPCEVCGGTVAGCAASGCRQCWGCGHVLHRICAGLVEWPRGPFHCHRCRQHFATTGVRDVTLDGPLMHVVGGG